jgi:hypothetical protein
MLPSGRRVLSLGAPTVARQLERLGCDVLLVDRQPELGVAKHLVADINDLLFKPIRGFEIAIVDPPWYRADFVQWVAYAASCVGPGGIVLASAWPESARPKAGDELNDAIRAMSDWTTVRRLPISSSYQLPRFERLAIEAGGPGPLSVSPRSGIMLEISVLREPVCRAAVHRREVWHRFVIDGYQLALRLSDVQTTCPRIMRHSKAVGWRWPFVSTRAPGRSEIDLWSSDGEVARVVSAATVAELLHRALVSRGRDEFERRLAVVPELLAWSIPHPPYQSFIEWRHQQ